MQLREVNSSNISKIGYENDTLLVEYKSGTQYRYKNVSTTLYEEFLKAESKGRFMNSNVKGKYEYERV